jgi:RNA polymerase sigma factor (sigma-70 family)
LNGSDPDSSSGHVDIAEPLAKDPSPSFSARLFEQGYEVRKALGRLAWDDREIIELYFYEAWSLSRIAQQRGVTSALLSQRFHAILRRLERELEPLR